MGMSALWIWYFHCGIIFFSNKQGVLKEIGEYIKATGSCGVDIFLILSGLGLYYHLSNHEIHTAGDYGKYVVRRFSRIYEVFLLATIVIAFARNWSFREFILNLLQYNNFRYYIYYYLWYVTCILVFYLVAPFYVCIMKKQKHYVAFTVFMLLMEVIILFVLKKWIREDLFRMLNRIPVFTLGFCIGRLEYDNEWPNKKCIYTIAGISLIIGIILTYFTITERIDIIIPSQKNLVYIFMAFGICLIIPVFLNQLEKSKIGCCLMRVFVFYGAMSLEFYCYHEKIDAYINKYSDSIIGDISSFIIATCIAYGTHCIIKCVHVKIEINNNWLKQIYKGEKS